MKKLTEMIDFESFPDRDYKKRNPKSQVAEPFVQWVGGKRQLIAEYEKHFPKNFGNYHEPFAGGAAVFYWLQSKYGESKKYYLTDMNKELILTYSVVRDYPEQVAELLEKMSEKHSKEFFYEVRNIDRQKVPDKNRYTKTMEVCEELEPISVAARFLYLNKTCYNALYRVNSENLFNVPVGKSLKKDLRDNGRLLACSRVFDTTKFSYGDYSRTLSEARPGDLVYFDPPYEPISDTSDFTSYTTEGFSFEDQEKLKHAFDILAKRGVFVALSNSNSPKILELYKQYNIEQFGANRCVNSDKSKRKGSVTEILVKSW
tara:strand:+ start:7371 stop:8318 length:948 start_codon:yes stop_codon:yes gene_type:complete